VRNEDGMYRLQDLDNSATRMASSSKRRPHDEIGLACIATVFTVGGAVGGAHPCHSSPPIVVSLVLFHAVTTCFLFLAHRIYCINLKIRESYKRGANSKGVPTQSELK